MTNLACIFPGQGSQSVGMLDNLAISYPVVMKTFNQVSECLGYDLWQLVAHGPATQLNQTEFTQVAMLTADVAVFNVLKQNGLGQVQFMAGHSLGEYAALVCSGALDIEQAAKLVQKRGQLMQQTVPVGEGAMAAIVGFTDEEVRSICTQASTSMQQVSPANYNAIGQVVIAGHREAVEHAVYLAEQAGARMAKIIPVSVPCHCGLLVEAADAFSEYLENTDFKVPEIPVLSNVDLSIYTSIPQMRQLLKEQLYSPVRWVETIQFFKQRELDLIIECGPGKVLNGLVKRIDRALVSLSVFDCESVELAVTQMTACER